MIFLLFACAAFASPEDFFADLDAFRASSRTLKTEVERFEASSARAVSRWAAFTPSVELEATKRKSRLNGADQPSTSSVGATANWNLFRGGGDLFLARGASDLKEAQKLAVESEGLEVENRAGKLLFESLYLKDSAAAQGELLKLKEEGLRIGRERYGQGKIPLQDVAKIEVDISQQKNRVRLAELELERNRANLKALFVEEFRTKDWPFSETKNLSNLGSAESPALKSLALRAQGEEAAWVSALSAHLPRLDLNLSYQQFPLSSRDNKQWQGSLDLSFPLWSRYSLKAASSEAYAAAAAAEHAAEIKGRQEKVDREFLAKRMMVSRENMEESRRNLEKAEKLYRDMLRSFQLGRLSTNELFEEQNRKIDTVLSYSLSRLSFHESLMEACLLWGQTARECLR